MWSLLRGLNIFLTIDFSHIATSHQFQCYCYLCLDMHCLWEIEYHFRVKIMSPISALLSVYLTNQIKYSALMRLRNKEVQIHGWGITQLRKWILGELCNRFCTIFATDSWQITRVHDESIDKMTSIIHSYRFVKPYIIYNIAQCIKILDTSLQYCSGVYDKNNMLVCTYVCLFVSIWFLLSSPEAQIC